MERDLEQRLFLFALGVLKMLMKLKGGKELDVIKYQLAKASTSVGANYEEAQGAVSRAEFSQKINISLKEIRESNYWLRILKELFAGNESLQYFTNESQELKLIPGKSQVRLKNNTNHNFHLILSY